MTCRNDVVTLDMGFVSSSNLLVLMFRVKEATRNADRMTKCHKRMADTFIGIATYMSLLNMGKKDPLGG